MDQPGFHYLNMSSTEMGSGEQGKFLKELADSVELPRKMKRRRGQTENTTSVGGRGSGGRTAAGTRGNGGRGTSIRAVSKPVAARASGGGRGMTSAKKTDSTVDLRSESNSESEESQSPAKKQKPKQSKYGPVFNCKSYFCVGCSLIYLIFRLSPPAPLLVPSRGEKANGSAETTEAPAIVTQLVQFMSMTQNFMQTTTSAIAQFSSRLDKMEPSGESCRPVQKEMYVEMQNKKMSIKLTQFF